jgi:hypothetical protein
MDGGGVAENVRRNALPRQSRRFASGCCDVLATSVTFLCFFRNRGALRNFLAGDPVNRGHSKQADSCLPALRPAQGASVAKGIPDVSIDWRDVVLGGAVTSFLFTIGKLLLGLYLGKASFASIFGAAGSIVVLVVWVYYSGQIFFLGAEFTKAFANRYGSQPAETPLVSFR